MTAVGCPVICAEVRVNRQNVSAILPAMLTGEWA
jgi:hypothetical protein